MPTAPADVRIGDVIEYVGFGRAVVVDLVGTSAHPGVAVRFGGTRIQLPLDRLFFKGVVRSTGGSAQSTPR